MDMFVHRFVSKHLFQAWLNQEEYGEIEAVAQTCSAQKVS